MKAGFRGTHAVRTTAADVPSLYEARRPPRRASGARARLFSSQLGELLQNPQQLTHDFPWIRTPTMSQGALNRRQFLLLPRLGLYRSALGRILWDRYIRSEIVATMGSPTLCGQDHLFDMFQHGRTYLVVRGGQFDDIRLALGFDTWREAEKVRNLLVAVGL